MDKTVIQQGDFQVVEDDEDLDDDEDPLDRLTIHLEDVEFD